MLEGSFYSTPSPTLLFVDLLLKVLCDDLEEWGGRGAQEGGDICILIADS